MQLPFRLQWPITRKSLASPDAEMLELFGIAGSGVTETAALRVPAVNSAIRVISEAVASLPIMVKHVGSDGKETDALDSEVLPFVTVQANEWTDAFSFIRQLVIDALMSDIGGLAHVNRVGDGKIFELVNYRRGVIAVEYDTVTGEPKYRINSLPVPTSSIIHLRSPFDRAPLSLAKEAIATSIAMERHARRLFERGARPGGVLKFAKGAGEEAVKNTRKAWRETHEGDDAGGRTAILYDGADFTPLTLTSVDAQFLQLRQHGNLEIARAFRVPPSMLFELGRATWSNTEQMGREFLIYCLEPWLRALEGSLRRALFTPDDRAKFAIRFDRDDLTRADLVTRANAINSLRASKIINANEGRDWLGLDGIGPEGDRFENPNTGTAPATSAVPTKDELPPKNDEEDDELDGRAE